MSLIVAAAENFAIFCSKLLQFREHYEIRCSVSFRQNANTDATLSLSLS